MVKFKNFSLKFVFVLFAIIIFILASAKSYSKTMFNNISDNFLRLHIVANSDSTEDQMLKYEIRDSIIEYISPFFKNVNTKNEAIEVLKCHMDDIYYIAYQVIESNGYEYTVKASIGNFYFPTKEYGQIKLPEGYYDALKIEIGNSDGQNWWCVMFPSLCIIDTTDCKFSNCSDELLKKNLGTEEYSLITGSDKANGLKIKFKLIELFENL